MLKLTQLVKRSESQTAQQSAKTVWTVRLGGWATVKVQRKVNADS